MPVKSRGPSPRARPRVALLVEFVESGEHAGSEAARSRGGDPGDRGGLNRIGRVASVSGGQVGTA
jgi:hypothetical protein